MYQKNLSSKDKLAILRVVERQLQAFQRNDAVTAFSLACPTLQRQLRQPRTFLEMIKLNYRPIYSPRAVIFEGVIHLQQRPTLQMILMTQAGDLVRGLCIMQQQADLSWRVAGCQLLPVCMERR